MGKLLSLLARDNSSSECCGPKSSCDIFLDFENAQPTSDELDVYKEVNEVLIKSDRILEEIQIYKVSYCFFLFAEKNRCADIFITFVKLLVEVNDRIFFILINSDVRTIQ